MRRRSLLASLGTAASGLFAGCAAPTTGAPPTDATTGGPATETQTTPRTGTPTTATSTSPDFGRPPGSLVNPGFERGYRGWLVGRDVPEDPNTDLPVESRAAVTEERAAAGERSLALSIDGRQDDGTIWVQQEADLSTATALSVSVYSPEESFNTITKVAAYAGPRPKRGYLREESFDTSAAVEDHAGWTAYEYPVDHDGVGVVAVGVSVVWETEVTRYVDDVRLS